MWREEFLEMKTIKISIATAGERHSFNFESDDDYISINRDGLYKYIINLCNSSTPSMRQLVGSAFVDVICNIDYYNVRNRLLANKEYLSSLVCFEQV